MTPTTSIEERVPSQAAVNKALETGQPQTKDTATLTSGSQVRLPENSNFSTVVGQPELTSAGKANGRPLESGVTFSEVIAASDGRLKTSTASVTLRARSDSVSGNNAFSLRVQGVSQRGQILDFWTDHWAGPGGFGPPRGQGDWAATIHDYNWNLNGPDEVHGINILMGLNPRLKPEVSKAFIQSNSALYRHAGGLQGAKMRLVFGVVNVFQKITH